MNSKLLPDKKPSVIYMLIYGDYQGAHRLHFTSINQLQDYIRENRKKFKHSECYDIYEERKDLRV